MINFTHFSHFRLGGFSETRVLKYLFFMIVMFIYTLILCANLLLIVVICKNRSLHEPMYIFPCSLFVNELFGSTGFFPLLLIQILSDSHTVSVPLCFLQIFCVYLYVNVELLILAAISYDRYLAICYPLQYISLMTFKKVGVLIAVSWLTACLSVACTVSLSSTLQLCGNIIDNVYCNNYSIVKLACSDTTINNIYGLFITALTVFVPLIWIFYTYMRILKVCFSGSKQTRQKAVSTCTPHLASLLNFTFGICIEVTQSRLNMSGVPSLLSIILSLYLLTCQPILNPVMYGLKMSKIFNICKSLFCSKALIIQLNR
ncbi:putative gustatory receptor clone PTE03 [Notolabrus celidotus]|uniref:putative gustatory receptor clone PTE03 n=1 Tax=Notolabrus celidotus TaxID=1203425 RepID=UPI00148FFCD4|nr:putative gustatory receptor clone PTE03 [Notolabrus celidotus]